MLEDKNKAGLLKLTRREFMQFAAMAGATSFLVCCTPQTEKTTKVPRKTELGTIYNEGRVITSRSTTDWFNFSNNIEINEKSLIGMIEFYEGLSNSEDIYDYRSEEVGFSFGLKSHEIINHMILFIPKGNQVPSWAKDKGTVTNISHNNMETYSIITVPGKSKDDLYHHNIFNKDLEAIVANSLAVETFNFTNNVVPKKDLWIIAQEIASNSIGLMYTSKQMEMDFKELAQKSEDINFRFLYQDNNTFLKLKPFLDEKVYEQIPQTGLPIKQLVF